MHYVGVLLDLQGFECLDQQQVPPLCWYHRTIESFAALDAGLAIHGKRQRLEDDVQVLIR